MKKQILKRILSSISATTLAVTSLGLNTVLAANAESAAPAAQTKEHTEAADHVHDDCCDGCCGEEAPAGQGVTIALLDAGVTNYETAGKTSFIDDDTIDSNHGNDMMSILKDTAPGADVLDVRVLDDDGKGTYANVEKGIRWAVDNSADIIVMSFVGDKKSALLENALTYAEEHEVLVVASAGNYSSEKACYPAAYPTVISVGALDENGNVQDYSNFGDYVDTFVEWSDGTSGAAQNVAAFAAITMQQSPEKSASDIRETYVADKSTSFEASKEDNADTVVYAAKCTSHRYKFKMTARAATCTTGGVEIWVCANSGCSASQTRNTKALGHNPGNWTREKNPTCTATGYDVRKCTRCRAVVNRRTLSALGHNAGNWTREKNPTCTATGSDVRKCTRCRAVVNRRTLSVLGHNPGNWTREKNPTCTATGSDIRKCTRCGAVVNRRTLSALGHNPGNWTREKNPTCTATGSDIRKCTRCNAVVNRRTLSALGHNPGNWTREKNPTCTANGSDIRKCTRCNAVVNRRTVNKLGHNPGNWTREKNPTCTVDGSDIRKCTRCKAIVSRRTVNKLGHNPGNWIREKNPTCTTNGSEIRKCIRCGAVVSRRTIAAPGHYFKFKQTAKPATCTTGGVEIWACTRSGCKATQTRNTKALGHAMSAWTTTPATCTSPAIQTRKCTRSGCTYKETRKTGSALGHAMSAWTTTTPATCTSPAIQTRKCTRKNCTYKETRKSGSALGHNFKLKQVAKPATCTTGGVEIWACTRSGCKATQTRNTKALGHSYKWVVTKQPTCTATGVKQYKCSRSGCGRVANSAAVPALGHNFKLKQVVKQATCTTAGVEIWACTRSGCKATQTKNIKALGHDLTAWKVITPATTTKEGKKERSCKRSGCKYKETAVIPKIGTLTIDDCGFKSFNFVGDGSLEEGQHSWPLYYDAGGKKYLLLNFETNTDWSVSATQSYVQILDKNLKKVTSGKAGKNTVLVAFTSFPVTSYDLARTASITFKANTTTKSYSLRQSNFTINGLEKKDYINQSKIASYIKELGANSAAAKALKGEGTIGTMSVYSFGDHRRIAVSNRKTTAKTIQIEYAVFKAKVNQGPNENEVEIELMDTNGMKLLQNGSLLTTTGVINSDYKHVYDEVYAQHEKNASMFTKFVTNAASLACSYFLPISNKLISFGVGYGRGKLISGVGKLITNCVFEDNGNNTVKTTSTVSLCDGCSFTNNGDSVTIYISNTSNTKCSINLRVVDSRGNSTPVQYNY